MSLNGKQISLQAGFTLIEILIAILIVVIGMVGASTLQTAAVKAQVNEHQNTQALIVLEDLAGRMRLEEDKSAYLVNNQTIDASYCNAAPSKACSAYDNKEAEDCTATESATFNIWNAFCRADSQLRAQFQTLTVSCAPLSGGACHIDAVYTLQAVVKARAVNMSSKDLSNQTISLRVYP